MADRGRYETWELGRRLAHYLPCHCVEVVTSRVLNRAPAHLRPMGGNLQTWGRITSPLGYYHPTRSLSWSLAFAFWCGRSSGPRQKVGSPCLLLSLRPCHQRSFSHWKGHHPDLSAHFQQLRPGLRCVVTDRVMTTMHVDRVTGGLGRCASCRC
jgi:hypothetical protein